MSVTNNPITQKYTTAIRLGSLSVAGQDHSGAACFTRNSVGIGDYLSVQTPLKMHGKRVQVCDLGNSKRNGPGGNRASERFAEEQQMGQ
jgi:hypothetical protein